jgi:LPXTG-motif cell wall-anchored protein
VEDVPDDVAGEAPGETAGGELPRTGSGIELAALTSIGLGLLLAGAALWPTSSWPPPRDRLSRSTTRR